MFRRQTRKREKQRAFGTSLSLQYEVGLAARETADGGFLMTAIELVSVDLGGGGADRDAVPLVRVEPQYPVGAKQKGIEGWVELMYTITKLGTVKDIVITATSAGRVFNRAAIQAVELPALPVLAPG